MARVDDLWFTKKAPRMTSRHPDTATTKEERDRKKRAKRYLAVWIGPDQKEKTKAFANKATAERHANAMSVDVERDQYIDPKVARITVRAWCSTWREGYASRRKSTVRQADVHLERIIAEFGDMRLSAVRPSQVKSWTARMREEGLSDSYIYALHSRLSQIMSDAVHDGIITRSPVSYRTSPGAAKQRAYVATTDQIWALYDAFPERLRVGVQLGAFAGLRVSEACGIRVAEDIDFLRGFINPAVQYPELPLKTETSRTPIPIPRSLSTELSVHVAAFEAKWLLTNERGEQLGPWALERAMRTARTKVEGLPEGFRFQDLRHYLASLLIASGNDVKVVQARLRHASAKTTLDTYSHLWPDSDESTRAAIDAVISARTEQRQNRAEGE